jgi:hypothetical protein
VGGSGSGSTVCVGFDYLNFHLYVECGCVDYVSLFWIVDFLML